MKRRTCLRALCSGAAASALGACGTQRQSDRSPGVSDAAELTATEVVLAIRDGAIGAEAYASTLLTRCEAARPLNAISWIDSTRVLASARAVDLARARGDTLGPLAGLPLLVKDNIDTLGFPSSAATPVLKTHFPAANAPVVELLFSRGAYLLAKANMSELALSATSSESAFGSVRNPYDPRRFAGGSSGGTAAGLAARLAPAGLGSDTAGSGRIPSALCGVVGFRPTMQPTPAYPNKGVVPLARSLDTIAPMARTVQDIALIHAAVLGQPPVAPSPLKGVRFGIARRFLWDDLEPEVARVTARAIERMKDAGAVFIEIDLKDIPETSWALQRNMMLAGMKGDLDAYLAEAGSPISRAEVLAGIQAPAIAGLFRSVASMPMTAELSKQLVEVQAPALRARFEGALRENEVSGIVFPCLFIPAQPIKSPNDPSPWIVNGREVGQQMLSRNTRLASALGIPAVTLPSGLTAEGLPAGLEFNAPSGDDRPLLAVCQGVEAVIGRLPPPERRGA